MTQLSEESSHVSFVLAGTKLNGRFVLVKTDNRWLLVKANDEQARTGSDVVAERPTSVRSGKTVQEVAASQSTSSDS